jgi:lipid A disaccharide synthetase
MIAKATVMPEFLAVGNSTKAVDQATEAMRKLLADPTARSAQREALLELSREFAQPGASQLAAEILHRELGGHRDQRSNTKPPRAA